MIIVPIGPILGIAGYVWSRKYLRYSVLGSVLIGGVAFVSAIKRAEAKAGPYGLRYGGSIAYTDGIILDDPTVRTGSRAYISESEIISIWHYKDAATVRNAIDRYKEGWDYATGDDLLAYIDNLP